MVSTLTPEDKKIISEFAVGWLLNFGSELVTSWYFNEWFNSPSGKAVYAPSVQAWISANPDYGKTLYEAGAAAGWQLGPLGLRIAAGEEPI